MNKITTDILIVGGGAAGMSAAVAAAESGAKVTVVDDNPHLGGQIWRAELGKTKSADAAKLIDAIEGGSIEIVNNAQVFDAADPNELVCRNPKWPPRIRISKTHPRHRSTRTVSAVPRLDAAERFRCRRAAGAGERRPKH